MEENNFVCGFLVCGPEEKNIMNLFKLTLLYLGKYYEIAEDDIITYECERPFTLQDIQKYSLIHPDNIFFYSWANEKTFSCGHLVVQDGKVLKNVSKIGKA